MILLGNRSFNQRCLHLTNKGNPYAYKIQFWKTNLLLSIKLWIWVKQIIWVVWSIPAFICSSDSIKTYEQDKNLLLEWTSLCLHEQQKKEVSFCFAKCWAWLIEKRRGKWLQNGCRYPVGLPTPLIIKSRKLCALEDWNSLYQGKIPV